MRLMGLRGPIHHVELGHCTFSILARGDKAGGLLVVRSASDPKLPLVESSFRQLAMALLTSTDDRTLQE